MNQMAIPATVSPQEREATALMQFVRLRCGAAQMLERAARLPGLPDQYRAQASTASRLAGLHLHRCMGANPSPTDALAYRDDITIIAGIVDALIEAIGGQAQIDLGLPNDAVKRYFREQLFGAIDGNATCVLEEAAEQIRDDRNEQRRR